MDVFDMLRIVGLNLHEWMTPQHCTPDQWFRWFIISQASFIGVTYGFFAWQMWRAKYVLKNLVSTDLGRSLTFVFLLCALEHVGHGWAYYHQYFKLVLLTYPLLVAAHIVLLITGSKVLNNLSRLKSVDEVDVMKDIMVEMSVGQKTTEALDSYNKKYDHFEELIGKRLKDKKLMNG